MINCFKGNKLAGIENVIRRNLNGKINDYSEKNLEKFCKGYI